MSNLTVTIGVQLMSDPLTDLAEKAAALRQLADAQKHTDLIEKRQKAEGWVSGYVVTGAGTGFVTGWIPGAGTAALIALETTMVYQIGRIYKTNFTMGEATATIAVISLASLAGKFAAMEATILLGPFAPVGKAAVAGGIIKAMGTLIITHFEDCA